MENGMSKKIFYLFLVLTLTLSMSLALYSCDDDEEDDGGGSWEDPNPDSGSGGDGSGGGGNPDTGSPTGVATIVIDSDTVIYSDLYGGAFNLSSISSYINRPGYIYKGIYDAPTGGALVVSTGGDFLMVLEKDITLYPRFDTVEYTLNFTTESGRIDSSDEYLSLRTGDSLPSPLPIPLYDENKLDFVGWEYNGTLISNKSTPAASYKHLNFGLENTETPIILKARFAPAVLKVIFDYNDGSYEQKIYETSYGAEFNFEFPEIAAVGSEVLCWSEDPSGSVPYYPSTITHSMTLYAIWIDFKEVEFYTLPEVFSEYKFYKGSEITAPIPEREGYEFDGWYVSNTFSGNPVSSFTYGALASKYYARWTPIEYDLSLYDGDRLHKSYTYTVEDELIFPNDLSKTGYTFAGWRDAEGTVFGKKEIGKVISGDLTAYYTPNVYNISYKADGAVVSSSKIEYDSEISFFIPEKRGYKFTGYTLNGAPYTDTVYRETEDIILEAAFEVIKYKIEYELYGAENGAGNILEYTVHDSFRFTEAYKENYSFEGWYTDPDYQNYYDEIAEGTIGNIKLYARFRGLSYAALLNASGGECQRDKVVIEYGAPYTIPVCTREGYSFDGWFTTPDGDGEQLTDENGKSLGVWDKGVLETEIYARYTKRHYITITTNYPAAVQMTLKEFYLVGELVTLNAIYDDGYMFLGYREQDADGAVVNYSAKYQFRMPDGDVKLYLEFNPNIYKITLNSGDAYCTDTEFSVDYGQSYTLPVAFIDGKQFVGWKYGEDFLTGPDGVSTDFYFFKEDIEVEAKFIDSTDGAKLIYTYEDLLTMSANPGGQYVLVNDINTAGRKWDIFDFTGSLDGLNHKISGLTSPLFNSVNGTVKNLTVDVSVELTNIEADRLPFGNLAYYINGGTLDNVISTGTIVTHGPYGVGGIAYDLRGGTIINCKNYATITTDGENDHTGGLFSAISGGTLKNCENYGTISGVNNIGGITGWVSNGTYRECTNFGRVSGNSNIGGFAGRAAYAGNFSYLSIYIRNKGTIEGIENVGGVFGYFCDERSDHYADYSMKITHLYNEGTVTGVTNVGGVMGSAVCQNPDRYSLVGYFENLENTGDVTGTSYVGGIIGNAYSDHSGSYIKNSSSKNSTVRGEYLVGGLVGRLNNILMSSCSNEGMTVIATGYLIEGTEYSAWLGGYIGYGTSIEYCDNASEVIYTSEGRFIGGIAGRLDGTVNYCNNTADVTAESSKYVGGIAGLSSSGGNRTTSKSTNSGNIKGATYVGGLFGCIEDIISDHYNDYTFVLNELKNTGSVTAYGETAGGIAGVIDANNTDRYSVYLNVTVLENRGDVFGTSYVGGISGKISSDVAGGTISMMNNYGIITGDKNLGGVFGAAYNTPISKAYNHADRIVCEAVDGAENIGGVIGYTSSNLDTLENFAEVININANQVGGVVGNISFGGNRVVTNLINHATVMGNTHVGGTVGYLNDTVSDHYNDYTFNVSYLINEAEVKGSVYVGGIVGYLYVNNPDRYSCYMNFTDSKNTADVAGDNNVGGAVGYSYSDNGANFIRIEVKDINVKGDYFVGGIVGRGDNIDISDCKNDGVTIDANGYYLDGTVYNAYIGGFAGYCRNVTNVTNGVTINYSGIGRFVGGIAGAIHGGLTSCTNNADVTAENAEYVAGLAGCIFSGSKLYECTNNGQIKGKNYVGGITGQLINNISDHYNDWNAALELVKNTGNITGNDYVGGLFGNYDINNTDRYSYRLSATSLDNSGNVTGNSFVGGLMGRFYSDGSGSTAQLSSQTGTVTGNENTDNYVGNNTNLTVS